jgi:hypothetical protein
LRDELAQRVHDALVVRGDAAEDAAGDHALHQRDVVRVHLGLFREGDSGRLSVGALAQPDADALREQPLGIVFCAAQIGLQYRTDRAGIESVQALGDRECGLGVGGAFHVNADKAAGARGVRGHLADQPLGQIRPDVHAHLGELYADVARAASASAIASSRRW